MGKLFPTVDPAHAQPLRTANFFTQQDIGGEATDYVNDAELRNAPNTTAFRRGAGVGTLLVSGLVFGRVDKQPTIRQLYQIAELGKPPTEPTNAPRFMRLLMSEISHGSMALGSTFATRSWRRFSTGAIRSRSAP